MRRSVAAKLRRYKLPGSARTLRDVLDRIESVTGRPVDVVSVHANSRRITAAWTHDETTNRDCIFVEASLSPYQRAAAILHEVGHLVAGHTATSPVEWPFLRGNQSSSLVAAGAARRMLLRSSADTAQEREAERIADVLLGALTSRAGEGNDFDAAFRP